MPAYSTPRITVARPLAGFEHLLQRYSAAVACSRFRQHRTEQFQTLADLTERNYRSSVIPLRLSLGK